MLISSHQSRHKENLDKRPSKKRARFDWGSERGPDAKKAISRLKDPSWTPEQQAAFAQHFAKKRRNRRILATLFILTLSAILIWIFNSIGLF